jgi:mycofactocin system glycosyltransferase
MSAAAQSVRLAAHTRRGAGGRLLVGGWPPRYVRLSAAGATALDEVLAGTPVPRAAALVRRLVSYGLLDPTAEGSDAEVTFVVPVRDGGPAIGSLVAGLIAHGPVIVVDDGSRDGSPALARSAGAKVVANAEAPGPAGARNTGWRHARTEFIAFIDADCRVDGDWARPLAALLDADPGLALVAPRIRGADGPGRLARWERTRSPLDMGRAGGLVGPGRRISYVPSAALVARRSALAELGGFDGALRFGEDVDLVWRAVASRRRVRYAPEIEVAHPARPTLRARLRQHYDYGTSAAALERRHPGAAAPLRPSRMMLPAALLASGSLRCASFAGAALAAIAAPRGAEAKVRLAVARLAIGGEVAGGRELARALAREWLPLTLLLAGRPGRLRRAALLAVALDIVAATAADPRAVASNAPLRVADNAAYCAGLWRGAVACRCPRVVLPARGRLLGPAPASVASGAGREPQDLAGTG